MKYKNLEHALHDTLDNIARHGSIVNSRGGTQREILFCNFSIEDPTDLGIQNPARKFSNDYAFSEWLWYMSQDRRSMNIGKLAKIWNQISDESGQVESNYGYYFASQWQWIIDTIISDRDTRRATICINNEHHKYGNPRDYPCTHYVHFFVRDDRLHMGVNMRSNDVVYGMCNDIFTFCLFQQLMLNELNAQGMDLRLGNYFHNAGSMHLYDVHFNMSDKILDKSLNYSEAPRDKFVLKPGVTWTTVEGEVGFFLCDTPREELLQNMKRVREEIIL